MHVCWWHTFCEWDWLCISIFEHYFLLFPPKLKWGLLSLSHFSKNAASPFELDPGVFFIFMKTSVFIYGTTTTTIITRDVSQMLISLRLFFFFCFTTELIRVNTLLTSVFIEIGYETTELYSIKPFFLWALEERKQFCFQFLPRTITVSLNDRHRLYFIFVQTLYWVVQNSSKLVQCQIT